MAHGPDDEVGLVVLDAMPTLLGDDLSTVARHGADLEQIRQTAEMAEQYVATLPNAVLLRVRKAGHLIWLDRPSIYTEAIIAFLLGRPLPQP